MKLLFTLVLAVTTFAADSLYDFKMAAIDGKMIDFSQFKGKTLLIVNVASKCGNTPQYADLQKLHETLGNKVTILGFPANNFRDQEPGTNEEIAEFCTANYGVTFQMFEKISVLGDDQHPLYAWLKEKTGGQEPNWNFSKYVVKPDGKVIYFRDKINPMDQQIIDAIVM